MNHNCAFATKRSFNYDNILEEKKTRRVEERMGREGEREERDKEEEALRGGKHEKPRGMRKDSSIPFKWKESGFPSSNKVFPKVIRFSFRRGNPGVP